MREWNEAVIGSSRVLRGGSFNGTYCFSVFDLNASVRSDYPFPPGGPYFLGFRVAEVPEPFSFALLSLGGLALVCRRKA